MYVISRNGQKLNPINRKATTERRDPKPKGVLQGRGNKGVGLGVLPGERVGFFLCLCLQNGKDGRKKIGGFIHDQGEDPKIKSVSNKGWVYEGNPVATGPCDL